MKTERFEMSLSPEDRTALEGLARHDGISQAGVLRRLLRQEARARGLIPDAHAFPPPKHGGDYGAGIDRPPR